MPRHEYKNCTREDFSLPQLTAASPLTMKLHRDNYIAPVQPTNEALGFGTPLVDRVLHFLDRYSQPSSSGDSAAHFAGAC
jgi:hypothetical protein